METEIQRLREEVSALEAWIEERREQLDSALAKHTDLLRILTVRALPPDELASEYQKAAAISKELDSLREPQQFLEAKKSLLYELESKQKYREAAGRTP